MNNIYQALHVPSDFFVGDEFYIEPEVLREFLSNMKGYGLKGRYNFDEIDIEKTINAHSGDCRLWNKDGYVVLSEDADCLIMRVDEDLIYTDIFDWLRHHIPTLHSQFERFGLQNR